MRFIQNQRRWLLYIMLQNTAYLGIRYLCHISHSSHQSLSVGIVVDGKMSGSIGHPIKVAVCHLILTECLAKAWGRAHKHHAKHKVVAWTSEATAKNCLVKSLQQNEILTFCEHLSDCEQLSDCG